MTLKRLRRLTPVLWAVGTLLTTSEFVFVPHMVRSLYTPVFCHFRSACFSPHRSHATLLTARVSTSDRHVEWYARNLGFNALVNKYEANEDPLKNFRELQQYMQGVMSYEPVFSVLHSSLL
jgi:hypothetical protein